MDGIKPAMSIPIVKYSVLGFQNSMCAPREALKFRPYLQTKKNLFEFFGKLFSSLGNITSMHFIDGMNGSVSDAEMSSNGLLIPNRVSGPALSIETFTTLNPIVDSTPSIVWDATGEASLLGIFGLVSSIEEDKSDVFAQVFNI